MKYTPHNRYDMERLIIWSMGRGEEKWDDPEKEKEREVGLLFYILLGGGDAQWQVGNDFTGC